MSTPVSSIVFPGSSEEYLLMEHRSNDSETGAATSNTYGYVKLPEGYTLDENGRLKLGADDLALQIGLATDEKAGLIKVGYVAEKTRVPVELDENGNAYVELGEALESASSSNISHAFGKNRWLVFDFTADNKKSVKIKKGTKIRLDIASGGETESRWYKANEDMHYDLSAAMAEFTGINGTNFYLYLAPDGEEDVKIVLSKNSTFPNDVNVSYTANNTRKIGQFHTLCVAVPAAQRAKMVAAHGSRTVESNYLVKKYKQDGDGFYNFYNKEIRAITTNAKADLITVDHPLAGFAAGDILPESVWCLSFRPFSDPAGMVYDPNTDRAIDIYLQSGTGALTASEYNKTHTVSREQQNHEDDYMQVGKRLLFDYEFTSAASGSNEGTNIAGSADATTVGGHSDTEGARMISFIGCEECCGYLWQWSENVGPCASEPNSNQTYDGLGWLGQTWGRVGGLLLGGDWQNAYAFGYGSRSRASNSGNLRSNVSPTDGGRGASGVLRG